MARVKNNSAIKDGLATAKCSYTSTLAKDKDSLARPIAFQSGMGVENLPCPSFFSKNLIGYYWTGKDSSDNSVMCHTAGCNQMTNVGKALSVVACGVQTSQIVKG